MGRPSEDSSIRPALKPVVLGVGHVGKRLVRFLNCEGVSRSTNPVFNWLDPKTWFDNSNCALIVTFAFNGASDAEFQKFKEWLLRSPQLILFSSVGGLVADGVLDEDAALKNEERYLREEELRREGALVLHLAGIYDQERNPVEWLKKNLISKQKRGVNLIHSRDICRLVSHFLKYPFPRERLLVSDGKEHLWSEIEEMAKKNNWLDSFYCRPDIHVKRAEKQLRINKLLKCVGDEFSFVEIDQGLKDIGM